MLQGKEQNRSREQEEKTREDTEKEQAKGRADRDRKPGPQCKTPAQASAPPSQFIPEKLAWSKGERRSRSTVFGNKNRKGWVRKQDPRRWHSDEHEVTGAMASKTGGT